MPRVSKKYVKVGKRPGKHQDSIFAPEVEDEQSRTSETEEAYLERFGKLWERFEKQRIEDRALELGTTSEELYQTLIEQGGMKELMNPIAYSEWVVKMAPSWEYSTFRQVKAASKLGLKNRFEFGGVLHAGLERLERVKKQDCKTGRRTAAKKAGQEITADMEKETSGHKAKSIPSKHLLALIQYLEENAHRDASEDEERRGKGRAPRGQWGIRSVKMLLASVATGLRPIEWDSAQAEEIKGEIYIRVRNAKGTNGRAHGEYRTVGIAADHPLSNVVMSHLREIQDFAIANPSKPGYYTAECNEAIKKVMQEIAQAQGIRYIALQMYTGRHQFSANVKRAGFSDAQISYMMGHNSARTARDHYGKAVSGHTRKTLGPLAPDTICAGEIVADAPPPEVSNSYKKGLADLLKNGRQSQSEIGGMKKSPGGYPELDM